MNRRLIFATSVLAFVCAAATLASASSGRSVAISDRVKGAQRVVVATAGAAHAVWRQNAHGDRLIVSQVQLQIEENLKGAGGSTAVLEVEGGTLDGFTLRVSDLPELNAGDRAVFFLDAAGNGSVQVPHLRGLGILMLDGGNRLVGSSLHLDDVRRAARGAQ
jgi:hypothetical protein